MSETNHSRGCTSPECPGWTNDRVCVAVAAPEIPWWQRIRWKIAWRALLVVATVVELYFITQYLTFREYIRLSGKTFAVGISFTVAMFAVIEVVKVVQVRGARRRIVAARKAAGLPVAFGPHGEVLGGYPPPPGMWKCSECGMQGIGAASSHVCPTFDDAA